MPFFENIFKDPFVREGETVLEWRDTRQFKVLAKNPTGGNRPDARRNFLRLRADRF